LRNYNDIAQKFANGCPVRSVKRFGSGNINDTFIVEFESEIANPYILQKINTNVFKQPKLIMENMRTIIDHITSRIKSENQTQHQWKIPQVLRSEDGLDYYQDDHLSFWRAITFIPHSKTYDKLEKPHHAHEAGYALGKFHELLSDLNVSTLHDTLIGFHIAPDYLKKFDLVLNQTTCDLDCEITRYCTQAIQQRRQSIDILEKAKTKGILKERPIHGDPKLANILFHQSEEHTLGIIDLDSVKPGLVHYDIGDCLRSCCNLLGEDTQSFDKITFNLTICQQVLNGYLSQAKVFFLKADYQYLYDCIYLIPLELGIRFFSDFLAGNPYYKIDYPKHNLYRGLTQIKLTESIESQKSEINIIIKKVIEKLNR
jgi:hypothetical protein